MSSQKPSLIAAEDIDTLTTWILPEVGSGSRVLASAEKEQRDRKLRENEVVEDFEGEVQLTPITAEELQALTEAAEKEGFEKGYKEGFSKGETDGRRLASEKVEKEARKTLEAQVGALLQVAEALIEPIAGQEDRLEKILLSSVCSLAREVIGRELQLDSRGILEAARAAVNALPVGAKAIVVAVNPEDLEIIESYAQAQQTDWSFRADASLQRGGCIVTTAESRVDYSVEQRIEHICQQYLDRSLHDQNAEDRGESSDLDDESSGEDAARDDLAEDNSAKDDSAKGDSVKGSAP